MQSENAYEGLNSVFLLGSMLQKRTMDQGERGSVI